MRKGGEAKFKIREVENERSRDQRIQVKKHGGRPAANGGKRLSLPRISSHRRWSGADSLCHY